MKTYTQATKAIELAVRKASSSGKEKRYQELLRALPNYVLDTMNNTGSGDRTSASLTTYVAMRVGALLQDTSDPFDPDNRVLAEAAKRVYEDSLVESVRRSGWLTHFKPFWTPYEDGRREVKLSHKARGASELERKVLDNITKYCEAV